MGNTYSDRNQSFNSTSKRNEESFRDKLLEKFKSVSSQYASKRPDPQKLSLEVTLFTESSSKKGDWDCGCASNNKKKDRNNPFIDKYYKKLKDPLKLVRKVVKELLAPLDYLFDNGIKIFFLQFRNIICKEQRLYLLDLESVLAYKGNTKRQDPLDLEVRKCTLPDIWKIFTSNDDEFETLYRETTTRYDRISLVIILTRLIAGDGMKLELDNIGTFSGLKQRLATYIKDNDVMKLMEMIIGTTTTNDVIFQRPKSNKTPEYNEEYHWASLCFANLKLLSSETSEKYTYYDVATNSKFRAYTTVEADNLTISQIETAIESFWKKNVDICAGFRRKIRKTDYNAIIMVEDYTGLTLENILREEILDHDDLKRFLIFLHKTFKAFQKEKISQSLLPDEIVFNKESRSFYLTNIGKIIFKRSSSSSNTPVTARSIFRLIVYFVLNIHKGEIPFSVYKTENVDNTDLLDYLRILNKPFLDENFETIYQFFLEINDKLRDDDLTKIFQEQMITYFIYTVYQSSVFPPIDNAQQKKRLIDTERPDIVDAPELSCHQKNTSDESNGINGHDKSLMTVIDDGSVASHQDPSKLPKAVDHNSIAATQEYFMNQTSNQKNLLFVYLIKDTSFEKDFVGIEDSLILKDKICNDYLSLIILRNLRTPWLLLHKNRRLKKMTGIGHQLLYFLLPLLQAFDASINNFRFLEGKIVSVSYILDNTVLMITDTTQQVEFKTEIEAYAIQILKSITTLPKKMAKKSQALLTLGRIEDVLIQMMTFDSLKKNGYTDIDINSDDNDNSTFLAKKNQTLYAVTRYPYTQTENTSDDVIYKMTELNNYLTQVLKDVYLPFDHLEKFSLPDGTEKILIFETSNDKNNYQSISKYLNIENSSTILEFLVDLIETYLKNPSWLPRFYCDDLVSNIPQTNLKDNNTLKNTKVYISIKHRNIDFSTHDFSSEKRSDPDATNDSWKNVGALLKEILVTIYGVNYDIVEIIETLGPWSIVLKKFFPNIPNLPTKILRLWRKFPSPTIPQYRNLAYFFKTAKTILDSEKNLLLETLSETQPVIKKLMKIKDKDNLIIFSSFSGLMTYFGECEQSLKPSGFGRQFSKDEIYKGNFVDGIRNGYGNLYYLKTKEHYQGNLKNGIYEGEGTLYYGTGSIRFQGNWVNGVLEGQGFATLVTGAIYEGEFQKGLFHGKGALKYSNGMVQMEGTFREGKRNGNFRTFDLEGKYIRDVYYKDDVVSRNPENKSKIKILEISPASDNNSNSNNNNVPNSNNNPPVNINTTTPSGTFNSNDPRIFSLRYSQLIYQEDIDRAEKFQWLNSKNINYYIGYLRELHEKEYFDESNKDYNLATGNHKRILFFSDSVYSTVAEQIASRYPEVISLETKSYNEPGFLIFDVFDRIVFAVNLGNTHWCVAEINTSNKDYYRFIRYDSLASASDNAYDNDVLVTLRKYALAEVKDKCKDREALRDYENKITTASYEVGDVERQQNGYDCGVFTCGFLKNIKDHQDRLSFRQSEVKEMRGFLTNLMQEKERDPLPNLKEIVMVPRKIKIREQN